jgi:hypothetical protein
MLAHDDAARSNHDEHLRQLANLLARGILRLRRRVLPELDNSSSETSGTCLELTEETRLSVTRG